MSMRRPRARARMRRRHAGRCATPERHDRVAHQLPRAVVRDVAAAVGRAPGPRPRSRAVRARAGDRRACPTCRRADARAGAGSRRSARACSARWSWSRLARTAPDRANGPAASLELGLPVAVSRARPSSRRGTRPAYAPSNARWSHVSTSIPVWRMAMVSSPSGPSIDDRPLLDAVGRQDRDLRLVDDRQRHERAERAGVRDRERAADHVVGMSCLARARAARSWTSREMRRSRLPSASRITGATSPRSRGRRRSPRFTSRWTTSTSSPTLAFTCGKSRPCRRPRAR